MCLTNQNLDQSQLEGTRLVATISRCCETKSEAHIVDELSDMEMLGCNE